MNRRPNKETSALMQTKRHGSTCSTTTCAAKHAVFLLSVYLHVKSCSCCVIVLLYVHVASCKAMYYMCNSVVVHVYSCCILVVHIGVGKMIRNEAQWNTKEHFHNTPLSWQTAILHYVRVCPLLCASNGCIHTRNHLETQYPTPTNTDV